MPELTDLIKQSEMDITLIFVNWIITLLSSVYSMRILLRIWDCVFSSKSSVMIFLVKFLTK